MNKNERIKLFNKFIDSFNIEDRKLSESIKKGFEVIFESEIKEVDNIDAKVSDMFIILKDGVYKVFVNDRNIYTGSDSKEMDEIINEFISKNKFANNIWYIDSKKEKMYMYLPTLTEGIFDLPRIFNPASRAISNVSERMRERTGDSKLSEEELEKQKAEKEREFKKARQAAWRASGSMASIVNYAKENPFAVETWVDEVLMPTIKKAKKDNPLLID